MSLGDDPPILEGGFKKVDKDQWIILHYSPFKVKYDKTTKLFLALYDINYICIKMKCKSILTSFGTTVATINKHFFHNKHTLFVLTKMCLFGEEEDFGKINNLYFFNFFVIGNIFSFLNQESFSPILQTKNLLEILETFVNQKKILYLRYKILHFSK